MMEDGNGAENRHCRCQLLLFDDWPGRNSAGQIVVHERNPSSTDELVANLNTLKNQFLYTKLYYIHGITVL